MLSFILASVALASGIRFFVKQQERYDQDVKALSRYEHPSLRPRRSEFVLQPEPSRHAYRGPTAIRTKANRHNRNRNKA